MRKTHRFDLYRRSGTASEDQRGRKVKAWEKMAEFCAGDLQALGGSVVPGPAGQQRRLSARLFVHPSELPADVEIQHGDAVVITDGRTSRTTFLVHAPVPLGERIERFDDEITLADLDEVVP